MTLATEAGAGATRPRRIETSNSPIVHRWLLGSVLAFGALLRIWGMRRFPFEQDELYTVIEARDLFDSPLNPGIEGRPLYYLLQHPLLEIMSVGHFSMRVLPVVFGIFGIWAIWLLARQVAGRRYAWIAAALVSISPWHLQASGMARYWSLIFLLSTLAFYFLLRAYTDDRPRDYLISLLVLGLGTLTHPTFMFPIVGFLTGMALVRADGNVGWTRPTRNSVKFLWFPLLVAFGAVVVISTAFGTDAVQNWGSRGLLAGVRLMAAIIDWSTPVLIVAGGLGFVILAVNEGPSTTQRRFAVAGLAGALSCLLLLSLAAARTSVYADYAIAMLPLLIVSAVGLIAAGAERFRGNRSLFGAVAALILLAGMAPSAASHLSDGTRFDYRPAFAHIEANAPQVTVLTLPIIIQRHYAPQLEGVELRMTSTFLDDQLQRERDLWVVVPVRRYGIWHDSEGALATWLPQHCRLTHTYQKPRFDYRMYRTDLYRCGGESVTGTLSASNLSRNP